MCVMLEHFGSVRYDQHFLWNAAKSDTRHHLDRAYRYEGRERERTIKESVIIDSAGQKRWAKEVEKMRALWTSQWSLVKVTCKRVKTNMTHLINPANPESLSLPHTQTHTHTHETTRKDQKVKRDKSPSQVEAKKSHRHKRVTFSGEFWLVTQGFTALTLTCIYSPKQRTRGRRDLISHWNRNSQWCVENVRLAQ